VRLSDQDWKHSCYFHCLAPVIDAISQPSLHYDTVLDLDRQIRDFSFSRPPRNKNDDSRFIVALSTALEAGKGTSFSALYDIIFNPFFSIVLLQLHRQFFTRALTTPEEPFSERNRYAPSVAAVVLSASRLIASLQEFHNREPLLAGRILGYWSNAHSAAVSNMSLLLYSYHPPKFVHVHILSLDRATLTRVLRSRPYDISAHTNHLWHLTTGGTVSPCLPRPICMSLFGSLASIGTCKNSVPCRKGYMSKGNANCREYTGS